MNEKTCKKCGVIDKPKTEKKVFKNGTEHIEARCNSCGNFLGYLSQGKPIDPLSPMPFGKYTGRSIMSIAHEDGAYARWASENLENKKYREAFADALNAL